ncbi:MAG TPA: AzlD domain-containing protein [Acidimicrobiales bacterium]|nr:AzlD domain-containing protein [Acidimicrobiales bacterium]
MVGAAGCYALKLAGHSLPARVLEGRRVRRVAALLPVVVLVSLTATQTFSTGHHLGVDARAGGLAAAVVAQVLRAPFLAVVVVGVAATALLRLLA